MINHDFRESIKYVILSKIIIMVEQPLSFFVFQKNPIFLITFLSKNFGHCCNHRPSFISKIKLKWKIKTEKWIFLFTSSQNLLFGFAILLSWGDPAQFRNVFSDFNFHSCRLVWKHFELKYHNCQGFFPCYVSFNVKGLLWEIDEMMF